MKLVLSEAEREMFRKTGAFGGKARAANMSKLERKAAASHAAKARWAKAKKA